MLAKWLDEALKASGTSQSELARHLTSALGRTIDRAAVNKMTKGTRKIYADEIKEIERFLSVAAPDAGPGQSAPVKPHVGKELPFAGYVAAGLWHPVDDLDQAGLDVPDFVLSHPAYPKARQYAYMVKGDSMNLVGIDDGMWVVAADAADFIDQYGETESGDLVVVERSRYQGSERELTVKEIRFYRDRYELIPRSSNTAHQPIIVPHNHGADGDKDQVRVIGVVLTSYRDHRRRK